MPNRGQLVGARTRSLRYQTTDLWGLPIGIDNFASVFSGDGLWAYGRTALCAVGKSVVTALSGLFWALLVVAALYVGFRLVSGIRERSRRDASVDVRRKALRSMPATSS